MSNYFILISTSIALVSPIIYAVSVIRGNAKPHRTTRFVLLIISALATLSLFSQGNRVAVWLALISTIQGIFVFGLSLKYGMGGWAKTDLICLAIALAGIISWQITDNPILGLYFAIGADLTGMIPTILKTYKFPETEVYIFFLLDTIAGLFSLMAVEEINFIDSAYPFYIMLINLTMTLIIIFPRKKL